MKIKMDNYHNLYILSSNDIWIHIGEIIKINPIRVMEDPNNSDRMLYKVVCLTEKIDDEADDLYNPILSDAILLITNYYEDANDYIRTLKWFLNKLNIELKE